MKQSKLPEYINCSGRVLHCDFYVHADCKGTCSFAQRMNKGIHHQAKTGLERFQDKYGDNYLQVAFGGMVEPLGEGNRIKNNIQSLFEEDMGDY